MHFNTVYPYMVVCALSANDKIDTTVLRGNYEKQQIFELPSSSDTVFSRIHKFPCFTFRSLQSDGDCGVE